MDTNSDDFFHVYDLEFAPPTFNIIFSIISAELARREFTQCHKTNVVLVPGSSEGFNKTSAYPSDVKWWRLWSIIIPALALMPSFGGFTLLTSRAEARKLEKLPKRHVFPLGYSVSNAADCPRQLTLNLNYALGFDLPSIEAPAQARVYVRRMIETLSGGRPVVTVTLRQAAYLHQRNSDLSTWATVCRYLRDKGYFVVVLPDYEQAATGCGEIFPDTFTAVACALNLHLRAALYEEAVLNVGTAGGAMALCLVNSRCNYIFSGVLVDGVGHSTEKAMHDNGLAVGKNPNYHDTYANWIWHEDGPDAIIHQCDDFFRKSADGAGRVTSDNALTGLDILSVLDASMGADVISNVIALFNHRRNGPVFVNRERIGAVDRKDQLRTKFDFGSA